MNRDDIIRMAREAGLGASLTHGVSEPVVWIEFTDWHDEVERFAALVTAHEREVCARIADSYGGPKEPMMVGTYEAGWHNAAEAIAADIRARGEA